MNPLHEETYQGCTIKINPDEDPISPREWDNVGTMACWHRRYDLGDVQPKESAHDYLLDLAQQAVADHYPEALLRVNRDTLLAKHYVVLPLYLYDHSGITIRTTAFECPWDSGQVGFIYCTMERARKEWTGTEKEIREKARACLIGEVQTYDDFLTGNVAGYIVESPKGETIQAICGYYPDHEDPSDPWKHLLSDARAEIDCWLKQQTEIEIATAPCHI